MQNPEKAIYFTFRQVLVVMSIIILLVAGYFIAKITSNNKQTAWIFVVLFYGLWIIFSLSILLKKSDIRLLLQPGKQTEWYFIPGLLSIPLFVLVFIPNRHLLRWDTWLLVNVFICLINPWLEEFYWRGLISRVFNETPLISYLISSVGFGLSHPIIFGVNSPGASGVPAFIGAFSIGSVWWFCLYKTKSIRGCIVTHFLIDVAGMAVFVLANKVALMRLPDMLPAFLR